MKHLLIIAMLAVVLTGAAAGIWGFRIRPLPPGYAIQVNEQGKYTWVNEAGKRSVVFKRFRFEAVTWAWQWYEYCKPEPEHIWKDVK